MKLASLHIKNFRGLQEVDLVTSTPATVIVGPNAMGKTTLLEAIRLARCLLMPSYPGEEQQVLTALGILSPNTQRLSVDALLGKRNLALGDQARYRVERARTRNAGEQRRRTRASTSSKYTRAATGTRAARTLSVPIVPLGDEIKKRLAELRIGGRKLNPTLVADPKGDSLRGSDQQRPPRPRACRVSE